jgi:hypothetical protein
VWCAVASAGCVHRSRPFDEYFVASRWMDASAAFMADSSLMNDERALHRAALLYGTPGRATYRPERADSILRRLLTRFPDSRFSGEAGEQLAMIEALVRERASAAGRIALLERRSAELDSTVRVLRQRLDALGSQSDSLRRSWGGLELDLRDRDEQLRSLRLELQRLKEIDLKPPRKPPG